MNLIIFTISAIACLWGIANEERLIAFEQKVEKYITAFFKVLKEEIKHV